MITEIIVSSPHDKCISFFTVFIIQVHDRTVTVNDCCVDTGGFQHFCYKTPALPPFNGEFTEQDWALIDCYDRKTPLYDMTKQVINEIRVFERVYFDFVWEGLIASVGTENENKDVFNLTESLLDRFSLLQNVVSDRNAVIG